MNILLRRRITSRPLFVLSVLGVRLHQASTFVAFHSPLLPRHPTNTGSASFRTGTLSTNMTNTDQVEGSSSCLAVCAKCKGAGKLIQPASRKAKKRYKLSNNPQEQRPPPRIDGCKICQGSGLIEVKPEESPTPNHNFPHVAIVGGGLGGLALAVACRHRGIPSTVYERDLTFFERSQGYGLTMQQASRGLASLGIPVPLEEGIVSTKHMVHTPEGRVVGEWGLRKWLSPEDQQRKTQAEQEKAKANKNKRQNIHIARQSLRFELLKALGGSTEVQWGHKLVGFSESENGVDLTFDVSQQHNSAASTVRKQATASLLVGADGIRSSVRKQWLGKETTPLRYLGCIVILGICPLSAEELTTLQSPLLDGETVFQTADGSTRIYMMPYSSKEYMWQLSFPMTEQQATELSREGPQALKDESLKRCHSWHDPIIPILQQTPVNLVSGYPVYDRDVLTREILQSAACASSRRVTLVGDAGHPMSPFKGQGANQALLDALCLARTLYKHFDSPAKKNEDEPQGGILKTVLETYEEEMLARSSVKVKASAEAAHFLHTEVAIQEGNVTRGTAAAQSIC